MEFSLETVLFCHIGPVSGKHNLRFLPSGSKKRKQKFVVGDDSGSLFWFEVKKNSNAATVASTVKFDTGHGISRVELGGSRDKRDRVFAAAGYQIRGFTRKGKNYFTFDTTLSEPIASMYVEDSRIWTAGEYGHTLFDEGRDIAFWSSPDKINDLTVDYVTRKSDLDVILACQDRFLRVVQGSSPALDATLDGPVTAVERYRASSVKPLRAVVSSSELRELIYGTGNGILGQVHVEEGGLRRGWRMLNSKGLGGVSVLATHDVTGDGVNELLVGRDDGKVQLFGMDSRSEPVLLFESGLEESIRGIAGGVAVNIDYEEMLVCTFAGRVVSFTTQPIGVTRASGDTYGRTEEEVAVEERMLLLKKDLAKLQDKVEKERSKRAMLFTKYIDSSSQFQMESKFKLDPNLAAYTLTLEAPVPLETVALSSDVPAELVDVKSRSEVVSRSPVPPGSKLRLLCTYHPTEPTSRMEIRLRLIEGQYGSLEVTGIAHGHKPSAQIISYPIKPLSMHHLIHCVPDKRVLNTLKFTGAFSLEQAHEWVCGCLTDVPHTPSGEVNELVFRNAFVGTILICITTENEAIFRSDSVSTISIVKEVITRAATAKKIHLDISADIKRETIPNVLHLLHPHLHHQTQLQRQMDLIDSVKEIQLAETDTSFLSDELKFVLENAEKIQREYKERPQVLDTLKGITTDLFVDMHRLKGHNGSHMIPDLTRLITNSYSLENVVAFFQQSL